MSTILALTQDVTVQAAQTTYHAAASGDGVLDWLTAKNSQTATLMRAAAVTLGIFFVIVQAVASRGAMARIIVSLAAAGVFIWGVWSVTDIKDRIENEVNSLGPQATQISADPPATVLPEPADRVVT